MQGSPAGVNVDVIVRKAHGRPSAAGLSAPSRMITATDIMRGKPDPEPYLKGSLRRIAW